jgi:hypothetical protein
MMKRLALLLSMLPGLVWAQSDPNWPDGYQPTMAEWDAEFASKYDAVGGAFTNLIINGGTLNGTFGGTPTFSGAMTLLAAPLGAGITALFASPPPIGSTAANTGAFTTLAASGAAITGPLTEVSAGPFTNVAMHDGASFMMGGASSTTEFQWSHAGNFATEALAAGIVVPAGSSVYQSNAIAGYVANGSTSAAGAVAGVFYARNTIAGATVYGINPLVTDQTNVGTGGVASTMVGAEFDIGAFNLSSVAYGMNMIGVFPNGTPSTAVAFQVANLDPAPWQVAFNTTAGSALTAINIGSLANAANSDSQPANFNTRDGSNVSRICGISAQHLTAGANLVFNCLAGGVIAATNFLATGSGTFQGGLVVTGGNAAVTGNVIASGNYSSAGSAGLNCSGSPTSGFTTHGGVVTAC